MKQHPKVLIIEDHTIVQYALMAIFEKKFPDALLHTVPTLDHALSYLEKNWIDLIILDIDIPGGNSPKMISTLRKIQPQVRILIHTGMDEEDNSVKYLTAGANGFLSKEDPFDAIEEAINAVLVGKNYISLKTKTIIADNYLKNPLKKTENMVLTTRETEIVRLLLNGNWTKEIANQLGIKGSTVSTHKLRIFEKFDVTNEIQLYRKIVREMPELLI